MRLTGHVYSNKLNTPLVRKKLPINPSDVPVRVLVVSPLATDSSVVARARMASIKEEYIIEPEKITATLKFFQKVGNKVMESIEYDEHELSQLPNRDVSFKMFHADYTTSLCEIEKESRPIGENEMQTQDHKGSPDDGASCFKNVKDSRAMVENQGAAAFNNVKTGGPNLLRTNDEAEEAVLVSANVTVGAAEDGDQNVHEQVVRALNDVSSTMKNPSSSESSSNTFIIRPTMNFGNDADEKYL